MAAAVGIAAKASHPLLQDRKPLSQTVWSPGRHSITVSRQVWIEQRLEQAWNPARVVSRLLQASMQELRTAAQLMASPWLGFQATAVARTMRQAAARRRLRMIPRFGALGRPSLR
jgi:hypothetical protein